MAHNEERGLRKFDTHRTDRKQKNQKISHNPFSEWMAEHKLVDLVKRKNFLLREKDKNI